MSAISVIRVRFGRLIARMWHRPRLDIWLLAAILLLMLIGLVTLYSAGNRNMALLVGQGERFVLGLILMLVVSHIPPALLRLWTPWLYGFSVLLLIVVAALGEGHGVSRWLDLGVIRFQPSELLKLTVPMMIAWYLHPRHLPPKWIDLLVIMILIGIPVGFIAKQPDLGTAILVTMTGAFVIFLAGIQWWRLGLAAALAAALAPVGWHLLHGYQKQRILTFLHPESDALGAGWHIIQSEIAVGSGGVLGKGFLQGTQSRLQFLPEHTTDFIFATFGEEFGLAGAVLLIALYAFIIGRGLFIAMNAKDVYSRLLAGAISMGFFVYVMVNGSMITGILPVVGVPLPLISYGGTSAVSLLVGFGVLMSVYAHRK